MPECNRGGFRMVYYSSTRVPGIRDPRREATAWYWVGAETTVENGIRRLRNPSDDISLIWTHDDGTTSQGGRNI